jgi:polyphosphate kinase 2 (PPK2 family)
MAKNTQLTPAEVVASVTFRPGDQLSDRDPRDISTAPGDKEATIAATAALLTELGPIQERLYAEGTGGGNRAVLLVLQGMDTSGKDGTVTRLISGMNPSGVKITSFKKPTAEELAHDFLWRIDKALPIGGDIGVGLGCRQTCGIPGIDIRSSGVVIDMHRKEYRNAGQKH